MDKRAMINAIGKQRNDIEILRVGVHELEQQNKRLEQMNTAAFSHLTRLALKMEGDGCEQKRESV